MNILQSVIFFISLALLIIGVHQTFTVGFYESYWLFMLSLVLFFVFRMMKKEDSKANNDDQKIESKKQKKHK